MQLTFVVTTCCPQQVACVVNKYITMATETIFVYQQWRVRLISQVNKRGACRATKWAECAYICWVFTEFNSCLHSEDVVLYTHRRKKRQQDYPTNEHILALIRHENELIHTFLFTFDPFTLWASCRKVLFLRFLDLLQFCWAGMGLFQQHQHNLV